MRSLSGHLGFCRSRVDRGGSVDGLAPRDFRPDRSGAVAAEIVMPATMLFTSGFRELDGFVWSKLSDEAPATTDFVGLYR